MTDRIAPEVMLLPCPFCGSTVVLPEDESIAELQKDYVYCDDCHSSAHIETWNRRAVEPAVSEEAIREIFDRLLNRSSHCMVQDGTGAYHDAIKAKRSDIEELRAALAHRTAASVGTQNAGGREASVCVWSQDGEDGDAYETSCGQAWCLTDGTPTENNVKFCHHCGKPIEEALYEFEPKD